MAVGIRKPKRCKGHPDRRLTEGKDDGEMIKTATSLLVFLAMSVFAPLAFAQTPPETPRQQAQAVPGTLENIFKAAVRLGAFNIDDDQFIDDFARVLHCDIYEKYHYNEFDWKRVRVALRASLKMEVGTYPTSIYLLRGEQFGLYDFNTGVLRLLPGSIMRRTNMLLLHRMEKGEACGTIGSVLPSDFVGVLDEPIQIDGVELSEEQARTVVAGMESGILEIGGQTVVERLAYGKYTITLSTVIRKADLHGGGAIWLGARLDNITLYEDADYQKPFWTGLSSITKAAKDQQQEFELIPFKGVGESP